MRQPHAGAQGNQLVFARGDYPPSQRGSQPFLPSPGRPLLIFRPLPRSVALLLLALTGGRCGVGSASVDSPAVNLFHKFVVAVELAEETFAAGG